MVKLGKRTPFISEIQEIKKITPTFTKVKIRKVWFSIFDNSISNIIKCGDKVEITSFNVRNNTWINNMGMKVWDKEIIINQLIIIDDTPFIKLDNEPKVPISDYVKENDKEAEELSKQLDDLLKDKH